MPKKRSSDEAGLPNAASSHPAPATSHKQKKRKGGNKGSWKSQTVPSDVPNNEVVKIEESIYDRVAAYNKSKESSLPETSHTLKKLKSKSVPAVEVSTNAVVQTKPRKIAKRSIGETGLSAAEGSVSHTQKMRKSEGVSRAIAEEEDDEVVFLYSKPAKPHTERPYHNPSNPPSSQIAPSPSNMSAPPTTEPQKEKNVEVEVDEEVINPKPAKAHTERPSRKMPTYSSFRMSTRSYNYTPPTSDSNTSNESLTTYASPTTQSIGQDKTYTTKKRLTTFPQFSRLSQELQDMIWALSILPRVVPLAVTEKRPVNCRKFHSSYPNPPRIGTNLRSNAPIPALLHVCQVSRAIGLKAYTLTFATSNSTPKVYFDFSQDCAYLQDHPRDVRRNAIVMSVILPSDHSKINHLAIRGNSILTNLRALPKLPALKSLDVVLHNFHDPYYENKAFSYEKMSAYSLLAPLFYNAKSASSAFSTTRTGDFATGRFMMKYELLRKEEYSDAELGRIRGSLENLGEEMEGVGVGFKVLGREAARGELVRAIKDGGVREVIDEWGKEVESEKK